MNIMVRLLLLFSGVAVTVAGPQETISLRVLILDDLEPRPVAFVDFEAVSESGPTVTQRTNEAGEVVFRLVPGSYTIRNVRPVQFKGKDYVWSKRVTVATGRTDSLTWTDADATSTVSIGTRQATTETAIYQKFKNSVVTVLSDAGKGSGFLIDKKNGLILTNSHVLTGSLSLAVAFSKREQVSAVVVAEDPRLDLAVIAVAPEKVANREQLPLLPTGQPIGSEGERVVAIGSPLHQEQVLTMGIISKVEENVLFSDVSINPGNSGGPVLNVAGQVVGVATFADLGRGTPGLGGIVPIRLGEPLIQAARAKVASLEVVSKPLPVVSSVSIPSDMLEAIASNIKKDPPFIAAPRNFRTYMITPFDMAASEVRYQQELQRKIARRYRGKLPPDQAAAFGPSGFWTTYVSSSNDPLVVFQVLPWPKQTSGSVWNQLLFGGAAGPAKLELRDDFLKLELYRNGQLVEPIRRSRIRDTKLYLSYSIELDDTAMAGVYSYDPREFRPGSKLQARVWKNDGRSSTDYQIPDSQLKRIWGQFEAWAEMAGDK